jgi:hypothetical protein
MLGFLLILLNHAIVMKFGFPFTIDPSMQIGLGKGEPFELISILVIVKSRGYALMLKF